MVQCLTGWFAPAVGGCSPKSVTGSLLYLDFFTIHASDRFPTIRHVTVEPETVSAVDSNLLFTEGDAMQAIPGFELQAELHQGNASLVYRGVRKHDGLPVIVKIHRNEFPTVSEIARFEHEYKVASPLLLRHGVRVLDFLRIGHSCALVYQDDGCFSLRRLTAGRPMVVDEWLGVAIRAASALAELQANRLVHGDINPNNILMHPETGEIKLTDFELINQTGDPDASLSLGTLAYIAPEQTGRVKARPDHRSDLYALGATLFELATGQQPFPKLDDAGLIHAHLAVVPPSVSSLRPDLPPVIDAVIQRLLAKSPADRYQTATGLRADLVALHRQLRSGEPLEMALGQRDFAAGLKLSSRLYGRNQQINALSLGLRKAQEHGGLQWLSLRGPPGIGKSSLLDQLEDVAGDRVVCRGRCVFGGLNPYAALVDAFDCLVQRWMSLPQEVLSPLRARLAAELGNNAGVLLPLVPGLEQLLGSLPQPATLEANAEQTRLDLATRAFLGFAMREQAPLVLAVDDLQWADTATLSFIEMLVRAQLGPCLLVTSERDESSSRLRHWYQRFDSPQYQPEQIELELLSEQDLAELINDVLALPSEIRDGLVRLLREKTLGNPFFVRQVLAQWADSCYLHVDANGQWQADLERIARLEVADNVLDLLVARIRSLPEAQRQVLRVAACAGNRFESKQLAAVLDRDDLPDILIQLADQGLLRAHQSAGRLEYAFVHDRVREAGLAELEPGERARWHLAIAQTLQTEPHSNVFAVVAQYNQGQSAIDSDEERASVARLNAQAAQLARDQAAFDMALEFAEHAFELWPRAAGQREPQFSLKLQVLLADSLASCARLNEATVAFEQALVMTDDPVTQAGVIERLVDALQSQGNPARACKEAERALALLGVELGLDDARWVSAEQARLHEELVRPETLSSIDDLPEAEEEAARISRLYGKTIIAVYFSNPSLLGYMTARAVEHVLATGLTPEAGETFAWWSMVLCMQGKYRQGEAYARLPRAIHQRFGNDYYGGSGRMLAAGMALCWTRTYDEVYVEAGEAADLLHQSGNLQFASYCLIVQHISTVIEASSLESMRQSCERWGNYCKKHVPLELRQARIRDYCIRRLMGRATEQLDCEALVAECEAESNLTDVCESLTEMARAAWIEEDFERALDYCERAEPAFQAGAAGSLLLNYGHAVIYAICLARVSRTQPGEQAQTMRDKAREVAQRVFQVTELAPGNFLAYDRLVASELHLMHDELASAMAQCMLAIGHAQQHQQTLLQAQAMRCLVMLFRQAGLDLAASIAREASQLFQQAGCLSMVSHDRTVSSQHSSPLHSNASSNANLESVDLASIIKANEAITSEIDYDRLLLRLVQLTVENTGAQNGVLVMEPEAPRVIACNHHGRIDEPLQRSQRCPEQILSYVLRTRLPVILEDGSRRNIYRDDRYFHSKEVRSVMAVPILRKDEVLGAVYLENNAVAGAFDRHRLQMIQHLLGGAAIALENAILYQQQKQYAEELEARVRQRTLQLEQANSVLTRLAELDGLTQISNRRAFDKYARLWLDAGHSLSLVLCDVDDFKAYNDHHGHMAGDDVLRKVAKALDSVDLFGKGLVARYGGEEFAVLLYDLDGESVAGIARACHQQVLGLGLEHVAARACDRVSVSVGVATEKRRLDELISSADRALYTAKAAGRNRVVLSAQLSKDESR